jgi:hypothetical protein
MDTANDELKKSTSTQEKVQGMNAGSIMGEKKPAPFEASKEEFKDGPVSKGGVIADAPTGMDKENLAQMPQSNYLPKGQGPTQGKIVEYHVVAQGDKAGGNYAKSVPAMMLHSWSGLSCNLILFVDSDDHPVLLRRSVPHKSMVNAEKVSHWDWAE